MYYIFGVINLITTLTHGLKMFDFANANVCNYAHIHKYRAKKIPLLRGAGYYCQSILLG